MTNLLFKLIAIGLIAFLASELAMRLGAHDTVGTFAIFGAISFFLGPYFDGAGFFVKGGNYVDKATPGAIWRFFGILLWIIGGITCLVTMHTR